MKFFISITVEHLGELLYKCKHCGEKFKRLELKKKHELIVHLGQKFTCDICAQQFAHPTSLGKHLRRVHNTNQIKLRTLVREMKKEEIIKSGKTIYQPPKKNPDLNKQQISWNNSGFVDLGLGVSSDEQIKSFLWKIQNENSTAKVMIMHIYSGVPNKRTFAFMIFFLLFKG